MRGSSRERLIRKRLEFPVIWFTVWTQIKVCGLDINEHKVKQLDDCGVKLSTASFHSKLQLFNGQRRFMVIQQTTCSHHMYTFHYYCTPVCHSIMFDFILYSSTLAAALFYVSDHSILLPIYTSIYSYECCWREPTAASL